MVQCVNPERTEVQPADQPYWGKDLHMVCVATGAKPETHTQTHTHLGKTPQNNKTCSPGGFVTASTRAAHCYGAISLMGLVSVRQRAKIIIFQGLNFIP